MPIRPEHRALYALNWPAISAWCRHTRAGDHCEHCDAENHTEVERRHPKTGLARWVEIVLTVAHLDHDPTNNDAGNLAALCQRCHLRHDAAHHAASRRARQRHSPRTRPFPFPTD